VKLLPPIAAPQKIICVGANYAEHAKEFGRDLPDEPIIFCKFPTALHAANEPVVLPRVSEKVDYEAELVVVIGREGRDIPESEALDYVAGYTCGNDVSARDWQFDKPSVQWLLGKSFDGFAPVGPWIVTPDEIPQPGNLDISLRLNGEIMQQSNTRHFIFPLPLLIAYVSQVCTLKPGDLLFTGTPSGVGMGRTPAVFLKPGDVMEVDIEKIGVLKNPIVAAS
jgi:2-keto-4-pentenoate hydratase/2-oxohepta-3-ene-1,7-dioic acid hydratase in catechol pathway